MEQSFFKKTSMILIMIILLIIPLKLILGTIQERSYRNHNAYREISATWGAAQNITGPVLTIPYYDTNGKLRHANFLPQELNVAADIKPEKRYRGIFEVIVYGSDISMAGTFARPDFSAWDIEPYQILWDKTVLILGINGLRGIQQIDTFQWNGNPASLKPGQKPVLGIQGLTANIFSTSNKKGESPEDWFEETNLFRINFSIHGSREIKFTPAAEQTRVEIESSWPHPAFRGNYLPSQRTITPEGFTASWQVSSFGRDYPGMWLSEEKSAAVFKSRLAGSQLGVELIQPVNFYTLSERSVKYGLLIIGLTFLCFFMFEILNRLKIHPMQYLLVGFGLCIFYLLLISFSEHIGFLPAYMLSAAACIILITWYTRYFLNRISASLITGGVLACFFSLFYIILQHEGYSLVIGASSLFFILTFVMWLTRKLDWYAVFKSAPGIKFKPFKSKRPAIEPKPVKGGTE
ncbi:MAG: cell envelope integrity protein CreD [Desulfobacterales bacterium]|nr:cell envelope integrity protein CreD [Desulfobacterales bacterium]